MFIIYRERFFLKFVFLLFMLVATTNAQSEFNYSEFRVSESDLQNSYYSKDSTANALVIYEYGNSFVSDGDYDVVTQYKKKVKIFNKEGFDEGTVKVYLYKNTNASQKIEEIKAKTYNKINGKFLITELKKENIYYEDYSDKYNLVKFTLPNLKKGSVITYSYELTSPFIFNFKAWYFQENIPKLYSEYNTKIPANYIYNIKLVGKKELDKNTSEVERECLTYGTASASCAKSLYVMKDIPAFHEEDYMTSKHNYLSKIEYELMKTEWFDGTEKIYTKTWKNVDREIERNESVGKELRKKKISEKLTIPLLITSNDALEKAKEIYKYVQENYSWNDEYRVFTNISLKKIIKEQSGSVTDINVLLRNLLKENGLDAKLVLVSTRENGLPTKIFPVISEFNYSIVNVVIGDKTYQLDATDPYLAFGQLPFRCLNSYGRQLDFKKESSWVTLVPKETSRTQIIANLKIDKNQQLTGELNTRYSGYHGLKKKKKYFSNKEEYYNNYEDKLRDYTVDSHTVKTEEITDKYFSENVKFSKGININNQDKIYFDPFLLKIFKSNPFKLQERTYPIDFGYKDSYSYYLTLDLGKDYELIELPKEIRMVLPDKKGSVYLSTKIIGSSIKVTMALNFKEASYSSLFYPALKQIMSEVVNAQTKSLIVLKKKK